MLFRAAFLATVVLLGVNQAVGSALGSPPVEIAKNPCLYYPSTLLQYPKLKSSL